MNLTTMLIGLAPILFGIYTFVLRIKSPEKFSKLAPMKEQYGDRAGTIIHTIAYSVMPIALGASILFAGFFGVPISDLF